MPPFTPQALDGTLNASTWTPITPPVGCDHVLVSNKSGNAALALRTVQGDASTELSIAAGVEQPIVVPPPRVNAKPNVSGVNYRFPATAVAFYLKTGSGTGTGAYLLWA